MSSEERLAAIVAAQHGVIARAQAVAAGLSKPQIDGRLRAAVWIRVLPRVYHEAAAMSSAVSPLWAAVLWAGTRSALSHRTAATLWRLEPVAPSPRVVPEIVVPAQRAPRADGIVVHRADATGDVVHVEGLPVTSPLRTIIDLAGVVDDDELGVMLESARLQGLVTRPALFARLDGLGSAGRPGAARLRRVASALGGPTAAALEAEVAHLLRARGVRAPVRRRGAFLWPGAMVLLECGRSERARRAIRSGWRVVVVSWDDLTAPEEVVARLARALSVPGVVASR